MLPVDLNQLQRSVRMTAGASQKLLESLDHDAPSDGASARQTERCTFRSKSTVVCLQQPGDADLTPFITHTRNLSSGGLAFLHGNYVHGGTDCVVILQALDSQWHSVKGVVVRCRHVSGLIHEVGVRFEESIDLGMFIRPSAHQPESDGEVAQTNVAK